MSTPALHIAPPSTPSAFTDRTPPYSAEAEMAVLGGMLIDQDAVVKAVEVVDDTMFHREAHRRLFRSLLRIWQRGDVIDEITVSDDLRKAGDFEAVGGVTFLASLLDAVPTAANIEYHCKIVREKAILRRLIEAATSIIQETYAWQGEVENLMDVAEQRIFQLAQSSDRRGFVWIKEILWPTFEKIEQLQANQSSITGVPTGFHDLDELTAGFQSSDLIIVAARPSMGKCLAHDAEIVLDDGSIATIADLYRRRSARLLTLNERWKLETTEPSAYVDDGEKPVFRVTTRLSGPAGDRMEWRDQAFRLISDLRKRAAQEKKEDKRRVLERARRGVFTVMIEAGEPLIDEGNLALAEIYLGLAVAARPEAPWPHLSLAQCLLKMGRKKDALLSLQRAKDAGLEAQDLADLETQIPEFAALASDPAFQKLVEGKLPAPETP